MSHKRDIGGERVKTYNGRVEILRFLSKPLQWYVVPVNLKTYLLDGHILAKFGVKKIELCR